MPRLDPAFCGQRGAPYDLMLLVGESDDALVAELRYSVDLFEPTTAGRWAAQLATLLAELVDRPEAAIHEVALLSPVERHQVAMEWSDALTNGLPIGRDEPIDVGLHHLFLRQARLRSAAVAVAGGDLQLSYGELAGRARRLGESLRGLGVATEARVALALDRRPELIVALLGVLEAGGAYVPLDLGSPRERLAFMIEDAGAVALVTDERSSAAAPPFDGPRLMLGPDLAASTPSGRATAQPIRPANAAYVLYTSGSTGRPKGVVVTHGGARNLAAAHRHTYLDADDRVGQITSLTFDASAFEIWSALARGARLELVPGELARSPGELAAFLAGRGITAQLLVTPVLNEVARQVPELLERLGCVWFGGEAGDPRWLRRLRRVAPQCRLVNLYGPTECSTVSTWCRVDEVPEHDGPLAIGRPFDGLRNRVLDPWLQAVGIGMPGELGVTGSGVARGYLERPALTAARFVPDPFATRAGERLYRTGDLVRARSDGQLVFLRRLDQQIKIRGRRIELEEIEAALAAQSGVEAAVVVLRRSGEGTEQLVAYLIAADPGAVPAREALRAALARTLPAYMIPAHLVFVERFPLTTHDKVDRGTLAKSPLPAADRSAEPATGSGDMEALLAEIWCQVLELETVGLDDSFFELGGHSLSLSRVQRQLEERLERRVPIADLFQHPTIRSLAVHLEPRRAPVPTLRSVDAVSQDGREIAIVAMACRFPGAGDLEAFWRNLRRGELSIATLGDDELHLWDAGTTGIAGELLYNRQLLDAATAARLAGHLESLLHHASLEASTPLTELALLSSAEHHQLLREFAERPVDPPAELTVPRRFAAQVAATPDAVAVVYEDRQVSYRRLDDDASVLAHRLQLVGVGPDRVVGCSTARSPGMLTGLLAILEAGGAYLPLDPELPAERGRFMIEQAQACVLLLDRDAPAAWRELDVPILELAAPADEPLGPCPEVTLSAVNLIYVLYTSGSTGEPKGVAVPHGAVLRLLDSDAFVRLGAEETLLQLAPVAFDASTFEIWGALLHGGRLALMPPRPLSIAELGEVVEQERVSTLWLTSALFQSMVDERAASLRGVRQLLAGGDVLSPPHVARALAALDDGVLINGYGPTEGTTFASCHRLDATASLAEGPIPLGRPVAGCRTLVVDPTLEPAAIGVAGELLLGGPRLARGYLHRPDLTAERFVPDPLAERAGERLYRTGDLVRWLPGGVLDFLRRRDQQLKIRGVRVEPAEIEQALLTHPGVRGAVVAAQGESVDERRLVAWILPRPGAQGLQAELRRYLRERLPAAMVPSFIAELEAFPLTASGKVDRRALAERDAALVSRATTSSRPLSALEERIAAVCRAVLGVPELGPDDDFFADLGAHSLLLAMLQIRLEEEGLELSVTDLFQAPSVAGLAERLESRDQAPAAVLARERWPKDVICLQEGKASGKPPLFLLHALGGHVFFYRDLVRQLDPDQPVYAVQARGLHADGEDATSLEELVAHYTADVLTVEPDGPYLLAGCSLGGILAFEMAHQLLDLGHRVDFVGLIDSPGPGDILPAPRDDAEALERFYRAERPFELERYRRLSLEEQMREYIEVLMLHGDLPAGFEMAHCYPILRLATTLAGLAHGYDPRSYPGAIHFYRAGIRYDHDPDFPELPWIERSRGAMAHVVPGDHVSMMRPPQVDELGALLAEHLARTPLALGKALS